MSSGAAVAAHAGNLSNLEHGLELGVLRLERLLDRERCGPRGSGTGGFMMLTFPRGGSLFVARICFCVFGLASRRELGCKTRSRSRGMWALGPARVPPKARKACRGVVGLAETSERVWDRCSGCGEDSSLELQPNSTARRNTAQTRPVFSEQWFYLVKVGWGGVRRSVRFLQRSCSVCRGIHSSRDVSCC